MDILQLLIIDRGKAELESVDLRTRRTLIQHEYWPPGTRRDVPTEEVINWFNAEISKREARIAELTQLIDGWAENSPEWGWS